jgi:hypothetical protein
MESTQETITAATYGPAQPGAGLIGYALNAGERAYSPLALQGAMFDYVLASDGLYINAKRDGLGVCFPIAPAEVRGLAECFETFAFDLPKVPEHVVRQILEISFGYAESSKETLFWLRHSALNPYDDGWLLEQPAQDRRPASCRPLAGQDDLYEKIIVEIHSHHSMPPRFSPTDDKDERGFRLYSVIGNLPEEPEIRMRVGVYGYFWEIPASWALELPAELADCNPDSEEKEINGKNAE